MHVAECHVQRKGWIRMRGFDRWQKLDQILASMIFEQPSNGKADHNSEFHNILVDLVKNLKANCVPEKVIQKVIDQLYYFVDAQLFNSFLKVPIHLR